jgi:membrane fusion protein, heavy metal efflux system
MKPCFVLVALGWAALGCRENAERHDGQSHAGEHEHEEETPAHEPNSVRIAPDMLRDLRITTARAEERPAGDGVMLLGELRVNEDAYAEVGPSVPARVARLVAAVGDEVKAGAPLVELENVDVGRARAELSSANTRVELAEKRVARLRGLAQDGITPARELEQAEAELGTARADGRAARDTLAALGARGAGSGSRFVLKSPIAGTVIERQAAQGRAADPERPLYRIAELSRLWLTVQAFERDAVRVRTASTARVTFPALPAQSFTGKVTLVGRQVEAGSRTIAVRVEVENQEGLLRPGMSATAWVALGDAKSTLIAVPAAALQRRGDGWCVFVPRAAGSFEMKSVGRGRDLGGEVEVLRGLSAGETVVVQGAFLLRAEADKARGEGQHHEH